MVFVSERFVLVEAFIQRKEERVRDLEERDVKRRKRGNGTN